MPTQKHAEVQQDATDPNTKKNGRDPLYAYLFPNRELSPSQIRAIDLMLHGLSDAQVAQHLDVDRSTVFRWRKDETFARELDRHRRTLLEQSTARLQTLLDPALDILQRQLTGDDPKAQLRAAAILVRMATPARLAQAARVSAADALVADKNLEQDEFDARLDAYINAPMPGSSTVQEEDDFETD